MKRHFSLFCSLLLALGPAWSAEPVSLCGTQRLNLREELHLHRQSMKIRERALRLRAEAGIPERAAYSADYGNISVIDSSGGVLARRNPFNLAGRSLRFKPEAAGYSITSAPRGFSADEAQRGEAVDLGDDDAKPAALGFDVRFFGLSYNTTWIHSDGTITFGQPDAATATRSLGRLAGGPPRVAALFADLDPSAAPGSVRLLREPGFVSITWLDTPEYRFAGLGPAQRFQIRIHAGGEIDLSWDSVTLFDAVVGISPGNQAPDLAVTALTDSFDKVFLGGVAERFGAAENIDIVRAAQRFYLTHEDAYDYLVIFNSMGIPVSPGALASETTVRSRTRGIGDEYVDAGREFGSRRRLQAVMNMGPLLQYPSDVTLPVGFRGRITGDNTLTLLGHEAGHLFLALASIRSGSSRPMLGSQNAHWSFNFNSDASLLEGNRIADRGATADPRFETTATVEGYSAMDQYLMGLRAPFEVPPTFVVSPSSASPFRLPEKGVQFRGERRDVTVDDVIAAEGRRIPSHTVAQSRFRFAFILITPEGEEPQAADVEKLEHIRSEFEPYYNRSSAGRGWADASLRKMLRLSAWPAMGLAAGQEADVSAEIARPLDYDLLIGVHTTHGHIQSPSPIRLTRGETRINFKVRGLSPGVSDLVAEAWNGPFEPVFARIDVKPSLASLQLIKHYTGGPVVLRVGDENELPYPGVRIKIVADGVTKFVDGYNKDFVTGQDGLMWIWWENAGTGSTLTAEIDGVPASRVTITR